MHYLATDPEDHNSFYSKGLAFMCPKTIADFRTMGVRGSQREGGGGRIGFVLHFLAVGCWLLAFGSWPCGIGFVSHFLAFGCWLLAVGLVELGSFRIFGLPRVRRS
jgi:hypothetical protein